VDKAKNLKGDAVNISLTPDLEAAVNEQARQLGTSPETVVMNLLLEKFGKPVFHFEPRDEWERRVLAAGTDCGVSPPHEALSSEGLYD
jgi:hypothetical protein